MIPSIWLIPVALVSAFIGWLTCAMCVASSNAEKSQPRPKKDGDKH